MCFAESADSDPSELCGEASFDYEMAAALNDPDFSWSAPIPAELLCFGFGGREDTRWW